MVRLQEKLRKVLIKFSEFHQEEIVPEEHDVGSETGYMGRKNPLS